MLPSVGRAGTTGGGGKKSAVAEEPDSKRRRLLEAGGPVEDDEVARRKMREAKVYKLGVDGTLLEYDGFDPDNVADVKSLIPYDVHQTKDTCIKPMAYFADEGDLPMMRWLYVNGADTRNVDASYWFPMYQAARHGHLDVCKWLYEHGAAGDVKRRTHVGIMRGREARIVRQLTELLPDVIIELGVLELDSDENSSDDFGILP